MAKMKRQKKIKAEVPTPPQAGQDLPATPEALGSEAAA